MPAETPEPTQEQRYCPRCRYNGTTAILRAVISQDGSAWESDHCDACGGTWFNDPPRSPAEAAPLRAEIERLKELVKETEQQLADTQCERTDQRRRAEAAEAKVERLTKERDEYRLDALPAKSLELEIERRRALAAEAKVLSLEAEIETLKGAFLARFKPLYLREMFANNPEKAIAFWDKQADAFCSNAQARALTLEKQLSDALAAASRAREEQGALRAALEAVQYSGWDYSEQDGHKFGLCPICSYHPHDKKCSVAAALAPPAAESNQQQLTGKGAK